MNHFPPAQPKNRKTTKQKKKTNRSNQKKKGNNRNRKDSKKKEREKERYITKFSCEPRQTSFDPVTMELLVERMIHPVCTIPLESRLSTWFLLLLLSPRPPRATAPSPSLYSHPTLYYVTSHYAPNPGTLRRSLLCRAGWLMFCGRIPVLSSRNKDFVCRTRRFALLPTLDIASIGQQFTHLHSLIPLRGRGRKRI